MKGIKSAITVKLQGKYGILCEELTYYRPKAPTYPPYRGSIYRGSITVPVGFKTDFASIPSFARPFIATLGDYNNAAILHDYLYIQAIYPRAECDEIFLHAMILLGIPKWKRNAMYYAVRVFGRSNYKVRS